MSMMLPVVTVASTRIFGTSRSRRVRYAMPSSAMYAAPTAAASVGVT